MTSLGNLQVKRQNQLSWKKNKNKQTKTKKRETYLGYPYIVFRCGMWKRRTHQSTASLLAVHRTPHYPQPTYGMMPISPQQVRSLQRLYHHRRLFVLIASCALDLRYVCRVGLLDPAALGWQQPFLQANGDIYKARVN